MSIAAAINAPPAAAPAAAAPNAPAPAGAPAPGSSPPAGTAPWYGADLPEDLRTVADTKKWASPADAIKSYANLEKLVGKDPNTTIVIPKDGEAEAWGNVYNRLGRPEKAEGYKVTDAKLGEALKGDAFLQSFQAKAHASGLSQKQFDESLAWYAETTGKAQADLNAKFKVDSDAAVAEFKTAAGAAADRMMAAVKKGGETLGLKGEELDALAQVIGPKRVLDAFSKLGLPLLEPQHVDGQTRNPDGQYTPAQAADRLKQLGADQAWQAKLRAKDVATVLEYDTLNAARAGMTLAEYHAARNSGQGARKG